jgi:hypothetical protein
MGAWGGSVQFMVVEWGDGEWGASRWTILTLAREEAEESEERESERERFTPIMSRKIWVEIEFWCCVEQLQG